MDYIEDQSLNESEKEYVEFLDESVRIPFYHNYHYRVIIKIA